MRFTRFFCKSVFFLFFVYPTLNVRGNNLALSNITITGQNVINDYILVQFDLSWENSWRYTSQLNGLSHVGVKNGGSGYTSAPLVTITGGGGTGATATASVVGGKVVGYTLTNKGSGYTSLPSVSLSGGGGMGATADPYIKGWWDAVWIFVKFRRNNGEWKHATLSSVAQDHIAPNGSIIESTTDGKGVFIYRANDGSGPILFNNVKLRWDYGLDGVSDNELIEIKVLGIEMVYVPEGSFAAGGGGSSISEFSLTTINTPHATTVPSGIGVLGGEEGGYPSNQSAPLSDSWPNGYSAFYCMKYEISQSQYCNFLNTLTYQQQEIRTATTPSRESGAGALISTNAKRNGIDIMVSGIEGIKPAEYALNLTDDGVFNSFNDGASLACNYLSWMDGCAYMDWSGLRPFTELEFEKACRGIQISLSSEYAWGTASLATTNYVLSNPGQSNEAIVGNYSELGNASYTSTDGNIEGPLRVGIFASNNTNIGRVTAGASYWGIMELSGNVWERVVVIENADGRAFTGIHGDGILSTNGNANQSNWPGLINGEVIGADGSGFRGGSWSNGSVALGVANRSNVTVSDIRRNLEFGYRGVRTAP